MNYSNMGSRSSESWGWQIKEVKMGDGEDLEN